jgi:glycosyltransferase involved in cell wall biosynthesis
MPDLLRVSVVIPVSNAERYVETTVRSALASDLSELEILVVDDGSKDRSEEIVHRIGDPRIVVIRLRSSGVPGRPLNVGMARARAPYVALLNADDLLKPDHLSSAAAALDRHPQAGFAFADFARIDGDGKILENSVIGSDPTFRKLSAEHAEDSWRLVPASELERGVLYGNFTGTSGVILRRSVITDIGPFDETLVDYEDRDLWFRLAHRSNALYRAQIGHSQRIATERRANKPTLRVARDRIRVFQREKERRKGRDERRQLDRLIAEERAAIGYEYRRRRNRFRSIASFMQAFIAHPDVRWMHALVSSLLS